MNKLFEAFGSKKLLVTIVSIVTIVMQRQQEGAPLGELVALAAVSMAYLIGQGLADMGKSRTRDVLAAIERGAISGKVAGEQFATELSPSVPPAASTIAKGGIVMVFLSLLSVLLCLGLLSGCAFWSDTVVPVVKECSPDQTYFIDGLSDVLGGDNAFEVLDRMQAEKGASFVLCALDRFLERVAATPENAKQRATARAYLDREGQ